MTTLSNSPINVTPINEISPAVDVRTWNEGVSRLNLNDMPVFITGRMDQIVALVTDPTFADLQISPAQRGSLGSIADARIEQIRLNARHHAAILKARTQGTVKIVRDLPYIPVSPSLISNVTFQADRLVAMLSPDSPIDSDYTEADPTLRRSYALKIDRMVRNGHRIPASYGKANWARMPGFLVRAGLNSRCKPGKFTPAIATPIYDISHKVQAQVIATIDKAIRKVRGVHTPTYIRSAIVESTPGSGKRMPGVKIVRRRLPRDWSASAKALDSMRHAIRFIPMHDTITIDPGVLHLSTLGRSELTLGLSANDVSKGMANRALHWTPINRATGVKGHWAIQESFHQIDGESFFAQQAPKNLRADSDPILTINETGHTCQGKNILAPTCFSGTRAPCAKGTITYLARRAKFLSGERYSHKATRSSARKGSTSKVASTPDRKIAAKARLAAIFG